MITITTDLDIVSSGVMPVIHLSQYDSDFTLVFNIFASRGVFTMPSGTTAEIRGTKTDGNGYDAAGTVSGTTVTITGDEQMTAVAGRNIYEIALYKDNKRLNTINFVLDVEHAALDADTITSESVLRELDAIVEGAETATDAATRAESALAEIIAIGTMIPADVKTALLTCFQHVAWTDESGQDYYDALEEALYESLYPRIIATVDLGSHTVYTDDPLDSLKPYMTVKYFENEEDTGTEIASANYTLSGTLTEGASTIQVEYDELTTSAIISGVVDYYNIWTWSMSIGNLEKVVGSVDPNQSDTTKYPSRTVIGNNANRRTYPTTRGKAPYYINNETAVASSYYPIPVPLNANHVKISMTPGQFIYVHTLPYDSANNYYGDSVTANRIQWADLSSGYVEKDLVRNDDKQFFMVINSKYDSAGQSYPVEPTSLTVEFSEVQNG